MILEDDHFRGSWKDWGRWDYGLLGSIVPAFEWADRGKPWKTSLSLANVLADIESGHLLNTKLKRLPLETTSTGKININIVTYKENCKRLMQLMNATSIMKQSLNYGPEGRRQTARHCKKWSLAYWDQVTTIKMISKRIIKTGCVSFCLSRNVIRDV
jgi:hypothetical protein